jgi:hypothetical protein
MGDEDVAEILKAGTPVLSTTLPGDPMRFPPIPVGEDIAAGDACYIKQTDGKAYRSDGSGTGVVGGSAEVDGFASLPAKVAQRDVVSLYHDVNFRYGSGLTPGKLLYLSTTVLGGLTDVVGTKQLAAIARTVAATLIRVNRTY